MHKICLTFDRTYHFQVPASCKAYNAGVQWDQFFPNLISLHLQPKSKPPEKSELTDRKKNPRTWESEWNHSEERIHFQAPAVNIIRGDDDDGVDERWTYIWDNIGRDDSTSLCSFIVTQHPPPHHHQTLIVRFWRQNICGYNLPCNYVGFENHRSKLWIVPHPKEKFRNWMSGHNGMSVSELTSKYIYSKGKKNIFRDDGLHIKSQN